MKRQAERATAIQGRNWKRDKQKRGKKRNGAKKGGKNDGRKE